MQTAFDQLWARVLEDPRDAAPQLVLADYLDEAGADPALAAGLRWCAANGKWPHETMSVWWWYWVDLNAGGEFVVGRYRLPKAVWDGIGGEYIQGPDARVPVRRVGEYALTLDSQLSRMTPEGTTRTGES